jgi:hypothetical protein
MPFPPNTCVGVQFDNSASNKRSTSKFDGELFRTNLANAMNIDQSLITAVEVRTVENGTASIVTFAFLDAPATTRYVVVSLTINLQLAFSL